MDVIIIDNNNSLTVLYNVSLLKKSSLLSDLCSNIYIF